MGSYRIRVLKTPVVYSGFCFECSGAVKGKVRGVAVIAYADGLAPNMAIPICKDCSDWETSPPDSDEVIAKIEPDFATDTDVPELVAVVNE